MAIASKKPKRRRAASVSAGSPAFFFAPITTFAPEPYEASPPALVVIQRSEDAFVASFFDANIHASGDTEEEAFRNLKSLILDIFESLSGEPPGRLGPEPKRQLAVLRQLIRKRR
jgi:predicted RNase H-like HicB family nuclease